MKFEHGKNYLYLFLVYAAFWTVVVAVSACFQLPFSGIKSCLPLFPIMLLFIVVSEMRSKVALDSWWVATHQAGSGTYSIMVAWHIFGFIFLSVLVTLGVVSM